MRIIDLAEESGYFPKKHNTIKELISTPEGRAYLAAHMHAPSRCTGKTYVNEDWTFYVKAVIDYERTKEVGCTD